MVDVACPEIIKLTFNTSALEAYTASLKLSQLDVGLAENVPLGQFIARTVFLFGNSVISFVG